ncbi:hypothetical protein TPA0907_02840 [Micromonospora humidisoli]|nr:hypothetical protein [Micromonospora sp. AKA109]GHJ05917.1 hypothetical protein TPA0907_02840 [Micromonospora sp. AKA109]
MIGLLPGYPLIAGWLGRLPVPELPDRPEEILKDRPVPERAKVFVTVARATELLTGMLLSASVCGALAIAFLLTADRTPAGALLALCGAGALLLRGRLFPTAAQRVPLLVSGLLGLSALAVAALLGTAPGGGRVLVWLGVVAAAALTLVAGLVYSPTPAVALPGSGRRPRRRARHHGADPAGLRGHRPVRGDPGDVRLDRRVRRTMTTRRGPAPVVPVHDPAGDVRVRDAREPTRSSRRCVGASARSSAG